MSTATNKIQQGLDALDDLRPEGHGLEQLAPLMERTQIERLLREQSGDAQAIENTIAQLESELTSISEDLKDTVRAARVSEARERFQPLIRDAAIRMAERRESAERQRRWWTASAFRRRASFDPADPAKNAAITAGWVARLQRVDWPTLLEHLRDSVAQPNLPVLELARSEILSRADTPDVVTGELDSLVHALDRLLEPVVAVNEMLDEVIELGHRSEVQALESLTGKAQPFEKIRRGLAQREHQTGEDVTADAQQQAENASESAA